MEEQKLTRTGSIETPFPRGSLDFLKESMSDSEDLKKVPSCLQCGTCTASCPVWKISVLTPRQLMRLIAIGDEHEVMRQEVLYYCSACYSCTSRCPAGIKITEIIRDLRNMMVDKNRGPLPPHIELVSSVKNYDNPWQRPRSQRDRWLKKVGFSPKILPRDKAQVLFYPGCTAAYVPAVQNVAVSAVSLLNELGVDFGILGRDEICCGSTSMRVGMREFFLNQARRNVEILNASGASIMVTACAGCYGVIKREYPRIVELKIEVLHVAEFLSRLLVERQDLLHPVEMAVAYHDPCHLARHMGITSEPRQVLSLIPGLSLLEMSRSGLDGRCCGGGGGLRTGHPQVATMIASGRIEEVVETGAEAVVTCCPFCELNLGEAGSAYGGIKVLDMVELLWLSVKGIRVFP